MYLLTYLVIASTGNFTLPLSTNVRLLFSRVDVHCTEWHRVEAC